MEKRLQNIKKEALVSMKIGPKHQITIPHSIFERLRLEAGDFLDAYMRDGEIVLVPKKLLPKDQLWFWSREWQRMEREAERDIMTGQVSGPFKNIQGLKKSLLK